MEAVLKMFIIKMSLRFGFLWDMFGCRESSSLDVFDSTVATDGDGDGFSAPPVQI